MTRPSEILKERAEKAMLGHEDNTVLSKGSASGRLAKIDAEGPTDDKINGNGPSGKPLQGVPGKACPRIECVCVVNFQNWREIAESASRKNDR